ncbi:MAG: hypothetical protein QME81_15435 [bacterium]|nr:hypothetical protein [bacterium]
MKTIDLKDRKVSFDNLLTLAISDSLLILAKNGHEYILEEADEFEKEVMMLGQSERFMSFLEGRRKEKGTISLEEIERKMNSGRSRKEGSTRGRP